MTDEERSRELTRSSFAAQMAMLGYEPNGNHKDMVEVVRCKDCKHRGKAEKCVLAAITVDKGFLFMLDNHGEWYCADGRKKDAD